MIALVGAGVSAAGSIAGGMAQSAVANYNAKVANINAAAAMREGFYNAGTTRDQYQEVASAQRAAFGNAGVVANSGSAETLQFENQRREEIAAGLDIWRARTQQTAYQNQAGQFKAEGAAARTAGFIGAATSLVSGISGMAGAGQLGSAAPIGLQMATAPTVLTRNPYGLPLGRV